MYSNKRDFTFFKNNNVIYFDNAGTSIKPKQVINAISKYYEVYSTNPHNSDSKLGYELFQKIENCRVKIKNFINAERKEEIIFVPSTTYALNQLAYSLGKKMIKQNDEIVLTEYEHSSNFLPWYRISKEKNLKIKFLKMKNDLIDIDKIDKVVNKNTKIISFAPNSNTFGYFNDPKIIISKIRKINNNAIIILDCAQSIVHQNINVQDYDVDFLTFSAHKIFGPTGIAVLYGKYNKLNELEPMIIGGGTFVANFFEKNNPNMFKLNYNNLPYKLEAGTPNVSGILGLSAAIDYVNKNLGSVEKIHEYLINLQNYAINKMDLILKNRIIIYNKKYPSTMILFNMKNIFSQDVANFLGNEKNIILRAGQHCNSLFGCLIKEQTSLRVSFSVFNTKKEIDKLINFLNKEKTFLGKLI